MTINDGIILTFILIGIIIIIVSFLLDKYQGHLLKKEQEHFEKKENQRIDYDEVLQKILELNEYGEYLKADLDKKQKELVFMYQMLLEKQKEITGMLNKPASITDETSVGNLEKKVNSAQMTKDNTESTTIPAFKSQSIKKDNNNSVTLNSNNFNAQIIQMTLEGYTSTEIAKTLNIGKGQVELVRNLYQ